jgi:hypothetical protein
VLSPFLITDFLASGQVCVLCVMLSCGKVILDSSVLFDLVNCNFIIHWAGGLSAFHSPLIC